ncbi:substrate-binding domain-containing protein [Eubacteriales bacterium OttesenSCG-928-K08]|nr:substrate-binding domain-containing protein [Eubacteriales bacterium OttesenSCG-928-K08]
MAKRIFSLTVLLTLLLFLCCACRPVSEQTPPSRQIVVGVVEHLSESSWRDRVHASIVEAANELDVQLITIETDRTLDAQIQAMRALITYQVDAIVVSPLVLRGWDNVLRDAKAAGVPVLMVHRNVQTDLEDVVAAYIGADYVEQGRMAAFYVREQRPPQSEQLLVMELHGNVGTSDTVERSRGIRGIFTYGGSYEIYHTVSCNYMYSRAREAMAAHLLTGRLPDILISYSDSMTLGAIAAMEEAGIAPGDDIFILSYDGQQDAIELLEQGKINCIIENDPNVGSAVMDCVMKLVSGQATQDIYLESRLFDNTLDFSALAPQGY